MELIGLDGFGIRFDKKDIIAIMKISGFNDVLKDDEIENKILFDREDRDKLDDQAFSSELSDLMVIKRLLNYLRKHPSVIGRESTYWAVIKSDKGNALVSYRSPLKSLVGVVKTDNEWIDGYQYKLYRNRNNKIMGKEETNPLDYLISHGKSKMVTNNIVTALIDGIGLIK